MSVVNRERVLRAATSSFLAHGYRSSVDHIARRAGVLVERLAAYLAKAMEDGRLRRDDPQLAAELFLGMLVGQDRIKRLFGVGCEENEARRAGRIVDCFLRAYS